MFGINYFKGDASTYVIRSVQGKIRAQGRGLSFFYNTSTTSIAALPMSAQDAPFIFNLQTGDFQEVSVQGQITFCISEPERTATMRRGSRCWKRHCRAGQRSRDAHGAQDGARSAHFRDHTSARIQSTDLAQHDRGGAIRAQG